MTASTAPFDLMTSCGQAAAHFIAACADLGVDEVILTARVPVAGYAENMAQLAAVVRG